MDRDASLTIRLPSAVKRALEEAAKAEARSVSTYCTLVLAAHLGLGDDLVPSPAPAGRGRRTGAGGSRRR